MGKNSTVPLINSRLDSMVRVTVIGAGIIGLPTAYRIQTTVPHARVTVVADRFSPNTTGDVAVGILGTVQCQGHSPALTDVRL